VLRVELIPLNRLVNGSYVSNEVFRGTASIYFRLVNASFLKARVVLSGRLDVVKGEELVCNGAYVLSHCRLLVSRSARSRSEPFNTTLTYLIYRRFNYAWLILEGGRREFIGFFPYYVFPDLSFSNVSKLNTVYMGEELKLLTDNDTGGPMPVHVNVSGTVLYTVRLSNKYLAIYLTHHYPVEVFGIVTLPQNLFHTNSSLARLYGVVPKALLDTVAKADDYPANVVVIDWGKVAVLAGVVGGCVAAAAYAILRRRGGRG